MNETEKKIGELVRDITMVNSPWRTKSEIKRRIAEILKSHDVVQKEKVKKWIFDNHCHHVGADGVMFSLDLENGTMEEETIEKPENLCHEHDYPYVNSLDLEKFIDNL